MLLPGKANRSKVTILIERKYSVFLERILLISAFNFFFFFLPTEISANHRNRESICWENSIPMIVNCLKIACKYIFGFAMPNNDSLLNYLSLCWIGG